jgi:hypothetical protein
MNLAMPMETPKRKRRIVAIVDALQRLPAESRRNRQPTLTVLLPTFSTAPSSENYESTR